MIKKTKNILFFVSTSSLTTASIATIVSCSEENKNNTQQTPSHLKNNDKNQENLYENLQLNLKTLLQDVILKIHYPFNTMTPYYDSWKFKHFGAEKKGLKATEVLKIFNEKKLDIIVHFLNKILEDENYKMTVEKAKDFFTDIVSKYEVKT